MCVKGTNLLYTSSKICYKNKLLMGINNKSRIFPEVKQPSKEYSTFRKCAIIALAEFVGTATLLFLSCTGTTFSIQGNISSMHTSFAAGFAVLVVIQVGKIVLLAFLSFFFNLNYPSTPSASR